MKKTIKTPIITFVLGLVIATIVGVSASILYQASEIGFTPKNKNWKVNNLESALNDLYDAKTSGSDADEVHWDFFAAKESQVFKAQFAGNYKLEVWGAQGGSYNDTYYGGYGAYSVGTVHLNKDETLYVNVGGAGVKSTVSGVNKGGYNGGANSYVITSSCSNIGGSGGGATHIAKVSGTLDQLEQYKGEYSEERKTYNSDKILIVAGGGGGAEYRYCSGNDYSYYSGGSAGGYIGSVSTNYKNYWSNTLGTAATQNNAGTGGSANNEAGSALGSFGKANQTSRSGGYTNCPGGGGGFYGGGSGAFVGGTGGSGYIGSSLLSNKHMTCYDCETSNDEHIKTQQVADSTKKSETPLADYAKMGNGFARITYLGN